MFRCARYIFKENKWLSVKVTFQRDWEVRRLRRWDRHSWSGHTGNFFQSRRVHYNYCDNDDGLSNIIGHNYVTIHPSLLSVCYLCILYHQLFKKKMFFFFLNIVHFVFWYCYNWHTLRKKQSTGWRINKVLFSLI